MVLPSYDALRTKSSERLFCDGLRAYEQKLRGICVWTAHAATPNFTQGPRNASVYRKIAKESSHAAQRFEGVVYRRIKGFVRRGKPFVEGYTEDGQGRVIRQASLRVRATPGANTRSDRSLERDLRQPRRE